jgi:acetyl esterase/lipase
MLSGVAPDPLERTPPMNLAILTLSLTLCAADGDAPKTELLWPKGAPGALGDKDADKPTLTIVLPPADKATGTAVVICPGGGYGGVVMDREGTAPAAWLAKRGVAAFVLKYRVAPYKHPAPMDDAQRALRTVRARAKEWGVDPKRVGVWGFSAGGHLASTVSTHFDSGKADADDPVDRVSSRPDFTILSYPVIDLNPPVAHMGSRKNLLGDNPDEKLVESLCNEKQVTKDTPPAFLFHTGDDAVVPVENSILYYSALKKAGVPAELHVYEHGAHGVDLAANDPVLSNWPDRLEAWMRAHGWMKEK